MAVIKTSSWFTKLPADHCRIGISRGTPSASTAVSNRSNSWSVSCFIPPLRSLGSKYRDDEAAVAASFVDGAGGVGFALVDLVLSVVFEARHDDLLG